jgi:hypothetical protein
LHPSIDLPSSFDGAGNTYLKLPPGMCPPSLAASNCIAPSSDLVGSIPLLGGGDASPARIHAGSDTYAHAHVNQYGLGPLGDSSATLSAAQLVEFAARFPRHGGGHEALQAAKEADPGSSVVSPPVAQVPANAIGIDNGSRDDSSALAERAPIESYAARAISDFDSLLDALDGRAPPPPPHTLLFGERKGGNSDASIHAGEDAQDAVPSTPELLRALRDQRQRFKQWAATAAHASAANTERTVAETDATAPPKPVSA